MGMLERRNPSLRQIGGGMGAAKKIMERLDDLLAAGMKEGQTIVNIRVLGKTMVQIQIPHAPYDDKELEYVELDDIIEGLKKRFGFRKYLGTVIGFLKKLEKEG